MAQFHHGSETKELPQGLRAVREVETGIVGLVGTAPVHLVKEENVRINDVTLILSDVAAAQYFGPDVQGFTVPGALNATFKQEAGKILVVNVFDPATHKQSVAAEAATFSDNKLVLANGAASVISATVKSQDGVTTYVEGTDYTLDKATGTVTRLETGSIAAGGDVTVDYDYADPSQVTASDIIGAVDEITGKRSGAQTFLDVFNRLGFFPKILIAPGYTTDRAVTVELQSLAQSRKCKAVVLADLPVGLTVQQAIEARGTGGVANIADARVVFCYPHVKALDPTTNEERLEPLSQYLAGVICYTDAELGYWFSPSNKRIVGITGLERDLSARVNDPASETNALNAAGIVTVFNSFGTGYRTWGNRSSLYPSDTSQDNFIQTRRTRDVLHESLELASLQFIDLVGTAQYVEAVMQTGQGMVNELIGKGAMMPGSKVEFLKERNPVTQLADGQYVFTITEGIPTPMERITWEAVVDITLLSALYSVQAA